LIACANVANLLLARSEARQREIALRAALGAGRLRLWRQLTTESCVLSAIGAGVGVFFAVFGVRALMAASPVDFPSFIHPVVETRVALFTLLVSLLCGIAMGFAPAVHARIAHLHNALKESSGRVSGGSLPQYFRSALVVAEISLTLVLLVGAGLLIRSVRALNAINPGFNPDHLLCLTAGLPRISQASSTTDQAPLSAQMILERIQALPSVQTVAAGSDLPLSGIENATFYTAEDQPAVNAQNMPRAYIHGITPEFFQTLQARLVAGRTFSPDEMSGKRGVVIVSENVARRFWPGQNPLTKRIKPGRPNSPGPWLSVIGVAGEMKYRGLPNNPTADPDIYLPLWSSERDILVVVRTPLDPAGLSTAVRSAIHDLDKAVTIFDVAAMTERMGEQTARSRFVGWLMGIFAGVALLLAVIGVYGVMSYLVTRRTQEIGLRMALGARRGDVLSLVVRQGMPVIFGGVVLGLATSLALTRLLRTLLYGVTATDALTFTAVPALLVAIALLACWLPALRASRVDPVQALRCE
jgi:predicted permease